MELKIHTELQQFMQIPQNSPCTNCRQLWGLQLMQTRGGYVGDTDFFFILAFRYSARKGKRIQSAERFSHCNLTSGKSEYLNTPYNVAKFRRIKSHSTLSTILQARVCARLCHKIYQKLFQLFGNKNLSSFSPAAPDWAQLLHQKLWKYCSMQ